MPVRRGVAMALSYSGGTAMYFFDRDGHAAPKRAGDHTRPRTSPIGTHLARPAPTSSTGTGGAGGHRAPDGGGSPGY